MLNIDDRLIREISPIIKPNALSVLLAIAVHLGETNNRCFPSHDTLMKITGLGRDAVYAALTTLKEAGLLKSYQSINKTQKTFGRRVFKVTTRFIGVFFSASDVEPLPENPYTDLPYTANPETYNIKHIKHSVANATESAIPTTENASKKPARGAVDPGAELGYTFENFWLGYGFKKGSKKNALAKWLRLKTEEVALIQATIEMYLRETATEDAGRDHAAFKPMRKHPEFYLSAKVWETYADLASESSAPTEYDGLYNEYLAWVKTHFPDTIPAVLYLSKQQYIAVKTHGYKAGARKIGDESIKFLLKQAHQQASTNKDKDVYSYYCTLIDERLKLHSI